MASTTRSRFRFSCICLTGEVSKQLLLRLLHLDRTLCRVCHPQSARHTIVLPPRKWIRAQLGQCITLVLRGVCYTWPFAFLALVRQKRDIEGPLALATSQFVAYVESMPTLALRLLTLCSDRVGMFSYKRALWTHLRNHPFASNCAHTELLIRAYCVSISPWISASTKRLEHRSTRYTSRPKRHPERLPAYKRRRSLLATAPPHRRPSTATSTPCARCSKIPPNDYTFVPNGAQIPP